MNYSAINIQGNIISLEILDKIRTDDQFPYQKSVDFGLGKGISLRDVIGNAWSEARTLWALYKNKMDKLREDDYGTTETRKLWMTPLLYELGYNIDPAQAEEIDGKSFPISHRDKDRDGFPILIMGYRDSLDKKPEGHRLRMSPHALMQDYLNHTEHLYGLVTNGRSLRLLRDSNRLAKLAYLEFDLQRMLEDDLYYEFALMYRVIHASRMPVNREEIEKSIFEFYHQESIDSGSRIRNKLRVAVKESMEIIANGILKDPANIAFSEKVEAGEVDAALFYKLLLRTIYRIIFLATIEERNLVFEKRSKDDPRYDELHRHRKIYTDYYSFERLRSLALSPVYIQPRKHDLWQGLLTTFRLFEPLGEGEKLSIQPLGGELFGTNSLCTDNINLYELKLENHYFLKVMGLLTTFRDERNQLTRVNYRDLDVEELGSVYEALLELHPVFHTDGVVPFFGFTEGSERKLTGSYYTRHDLVAQLIKTALIPVMEQRLKAAPTPREKEKALLSITVCDPAAGSGHFLLSASRTLGFELARIRSGEENPGEEWVTRATRDVVQNCIYGVDKNPAAVELCRLSLWLIGHNSGKPLTFLEHKIKCGDSLVGIDRLSRLTEGIPDGAFKPVTGDDKKTAADFKRRNREFLKKRQLSLFDQSEKLENHQHEYAERYRQLVHQRVESQQDYENKKHEYEQFLHNPKHFKDVTACNLFTYAFFQPYKEGQQEHETVTSRDLALFLNAAGSINARLEARADVAAQQYRFFHWPLEFPDVFEKGGFDVILGNPPWDIIELKEKEFFAARDKSIAEAENKSKRTKLIEKLKEEKPELYEEYFSELHYVNSMRRFIQESNVLNLTIRGRTNTYSVFSEMVSKKLNEKGKGGIIVPTGIATDDSNKFFFASLIENNQLDSLYDFENRKGLFPGVHRSYKFCLFSLSGGALPSSHKINFAFFLHDVLDLQDKLRVFQLSKDDFLRINPNTKTTPIFRTKIDAELTAKIYSRVPVLINESKNQNPWGITFRQGLFNMSSDSHLFRTEAQLREQGFVLKGNRFVRGEEMWLPLYESKMIWHYDHRFGSYAGVKSRTSTHLPTPTLEQYQDPSYQIKPWYWINKKEVEVKVENDMCFFLGFRKTTNSTNERTSIFSLLTYSAVSDKLQLVFSNQKYLKFLAANFNNIIFDYFVRQKIGGTDLTYHYVRQLPVFTFDFYQNEFIKSLVKIILELTYTSWDIKAFADDIWKEVDDELRDAIRQQWEENQTATGGHEWKIPEWAGAYPEIAWERDKGCPLPPFKWDEERRARLKAELDAYYALLYGLTRDELRYILDPQEVYGEDFPGETFRVLKEKEIRKYGEYRTRRLVLEAYDRLAPGWDREAHLQKLKEVWEKYQEDLSPKKEKKRIKKKPPATVNEPAASYGQTSLFEEPPAVAPATVRENTKVIIKNREGKVFRYLLCKTAQKGSFSGEYKHLALDTNLAKALLGKKAGDTFVFGGMEYEVVSIK